MNWLNHINILEKSQLLQQTQKANIKDKKIILKIDVERHEEQVLLGASKLLTENKVIIQIEIFDKRKKKIFDILKNYKYQLYNSIGKDYYFRNFI